MATNKQKTTTKKDTEPVKKESVNQKMTSELYGQLRDKGYTHEQIKSAWSDTKTPKMTKELYGSLRDKGYTHEQIKAGQYSRENLMPWLTSKDANKTFSSWSKSANDFSTWSNSQPKDWAKWDPAQANKWADILTKNAQQANSILADLKKQGAKAGIEEYDAYQSYADYFTKAAQQLRNNNSSYNSYRDANMYKASDGNYYTYDDVLKMEESLSNEISGMSSLNFRIKSGYGTNGAGLPNFGIEITGEGTKKREKQSELEAMQTWIGEKNKQKDQTSWYADNFRPNMDTGKFYENAVATKDELEARKTELEKSKPNLQLDYAKVDELGNVYDYDYDAYNDDLEKWNKANAAFYAQYDAAQRDYTYASDPNFRFYSAVKNANVNSPEAKAVIEEGKRRDGVYADFDSTKIGTEGIGSTAPLTFESWLDSFARGLSGSSVNPGSTGVALQQANAAMYAGYTQSKHADIGTWSEDKLNAYYFLRGMGDDAGADRLAQLTNEAIAQAGIQKELYDPLDKFQEDHPVLGTVAATGAAMVPLFTGIPEYLTYVDMYMVTGGYIDKSTMSLMPSNISSRMVGNAANMMNEWGTLPEGIPVLGGKGVGDAYQLGISILQSALSRNMSGGMQAATLAQFFGSAASSGIFEGLNRGLEPNKALLLGTMNGFAEAIGEVVSLDKLVSIKSSAGARAVVKDVLVQMGIEGSEEAFTTVMNTLADVLVNADKSELEIAIQTYMSQGKSREEAEKQAVKDWLNGVAFDFIGGAVSGGVSAGGANITRNIGTYKGSTQYLMDLAEQTPEGSKSREMLPAIQDEYTKKSQRKKQNRQNISAWHGNQFAQQVSDDLRASNRDAAVKAIENRLSELGETGDLNQKAQVMADALIDGMMGEETGGWAMTPSADFSANATANMQQVMNELSEARENFTAADYARASENWTDEVMKGRFLDADVLAGKGYASPNYQYGRAAEKFYTDHTNQIANLEQNISGMRQEISEAKKELGRTSPTDTAQRRALQEKISNLEGQISEAEESIKSHRDALLQDGYDSYTEQQKAATVKIKGKEYTASGLVMQDGEPHVKLTGADGSTQTVSIDDERLPDSLKSLAVKVKSLGWAASAAFQYYKPGTSISDYVNRVANIQAFITDKMNKEAFMNSAVVRALDNAPLAEFLYSEGQSRGEKIRKAYNDKLEETKKKIKEAQQEAKKKTGSEEGRVKGKGKVDTTSGYTLSDGTHFDGIEGMELSDTQQAVVRMIENLSDTLGINYILFNGDARGVLGVYKQGGTVAVNINAGSYSNGKLVRSLAAETLSHELTHFIEQFAAEEYQALQDAVIEVLFSKDSAKFAERVQHQKAMLPKNIKEGRTFKEAVKAYMDQGMTRADAEEAALNDAAIREVVADACTVMLKNSKTVTELARQNMTAAQKVADFIEQTVQKIRSTIEKAFSESDPKYYRDEAKLILDEMERIQQLWDAGLKAATENYNALQEGGAASEQFQVADAVAQAAEEDNAPAIAESMDQYQIWTEDLPQKTQYGFKLMNVDENGLPHAMFIDAANPYELGQWYTADSPKMENLIKLDPGYAYLVDENDVADMDSRIPIRKEKGAFRGLPGKTAVNKATNEGKRWMVVDQYADGSKSIHNVGINGSGGVSTFALRPGIHAVDIPSMAHIGSKSEGSSKIDTRRANQAWFLIEYPVDVDYNQEAFSHQTKDIREHLPEKGWYSYQTNSGAESRQHWFITGGMRVVGMVSEADARKYAKDRGFEEDLPWKMGKAYDEAAHAINLDEYINTTKAKPTPSKSEMARRIAEGTTEQYQVADQEHQDQINRTDGLSTVQSSDEGQAQYQMADNAADDTTFESEERTKAWTDLRAENEILRDATKKLNDELRKMGRQAQQTEARYARDTEKLASQRDKAKAQLKRTTTPETRLNDAKKLAREIVKMTQREAVTTREKQYNREMADELAGRIKAVADYIVQSGENIDYDKVTEMAYEIAHDIVSNAEAEIDDGGATKEMRELMQAALKGRAIYVPPNVRADTLDWNAFKKAHRDIFTFRDNGLDIDIVYESLLQEVPGLLDPNINNPGDMLNEMAEKWDLLQPKYENPYEQYENEATSHYMNMIIQSALEGQLRQVAPTYADRMNDRIARLRGEKREAVKAAKAEGRQKLSDLRAEKNERIEEIRQEGITRKQEALAKERADKWERVEATRQYYQNMAERAATRRANGSTRTRIKKLINDLNTRLTHPTEKKYVPAHLVKNTIDILEMIDMDTGRGNVKLQEKIALLQQQYAALKADESFNGYAYDPIIEDGIANMARAIGDTPLRNMSSTQLETVLSTLKSIEHTIRTAVSDKLYDEEWNFFESAKAASKATNGVSATSANALGKAADWYTINTMRPDVVFDRFGGFAKGNEWERIAEMLNKAQRYGMDLQMMFAKPFEELLSDKKSLAKLTSTKEGDMVDIGLKDENGEAIRITRDFMLFVYMNLMSEDNIKHIMYGGITVPEIKEYLSGKGDRGYGKGARQAVGISQKLAEINNAISNETDATEKARLLEEKDSILQEGMEYIDRLRSSIEEQLTDYDRKWVKAWGEFNEMATKVLNDTTMQVYGIKKFIVENYFPIITDRNFLNVPMETIIKDMSLENAGFTKERIHASNPIKMMGLADVINMQASRTAQYAAIMPATRAFSKIYSKTMPGYSTSVKKALNNKFGGEAIKFVENLMADLQGGRRSDFTIFDRMRGRMAQATLSLNPRVALAQTASFPTAAAELGWRPVMKALRKGGKDNRFISAAERELIAKWSSALWYRNKGGTVELGDIKNMQQAQHKVMDKMGWAMNWISFMDSATVGRLWYAAQYYVDEKNPELQKGSDAYYEKVAEAFNRCVERTQPNYTTMQRPELLRNPHAAYRMLFMFMTQRLQNQSILYGATAKYLKYKSDLASGKNGVTQADVNEMRSRFVNAATSQVVAAMSIALFKALCDGLLHRWGKKYRDDDEKLTAGSVSLEIMDMFAESLVSNVVGGSEIYSAVKSIVTGEKYYGVEMSGFSTFNDAVKDFVSLAQQPSLKSAKKLAESLCTFLGIPAANAEKIGLALWYWGEDMIKGEFMEAGVERTSAQNARLLTMAYAEGDEKKIEKYSAEFKDDDAKMDAVRQNIKDGYVAKKQTISKTEAVELLVKAGMRKKDAEAKVQEWTCEIVTGIPFSKIKDEYMAGNITQFRVAELLQTYGGRTKENAEKTARSYACEKDTGHPYNDLKEAYLEGEITRAQLTSALKKYGAMNSTESENKATYYDYLKSMPDSKISEQRAVTFMKSIKKTGVTAKAYEDMVLNVDADDSGGYSQKEVGRYIQTHSFTYAQINALWKAFGKTWKTDFYTWEVKTAADAAGTGKGANNGNVSQAELGYYLADQIRAGKMTIEQAEKYWSSLLTTSKKSFSQWAKSKRIKFK